MTFNGFSPMRKGTLLILSGSAEHLFFICNDPCFYPRMAKDAFLGVNISSIKQGVDHDTTCVVFPGEHEFVSRPSFTFYGRAEIFGAESVAQRVESGEFRTHAPCSDSLFSRILQGFHTSPFVRPNIQKYAATYCR